jgi:hypothetical protein
VVWYALSKYTDVSLLYTVSSDHLKDVELSVRRNQRHRRSKSKRKPIFGIVSADRLVEELDFFELQVPRWSVLERAYVAVIFG